MKPADLARETASSPAGRGRSSPATAGSGVSGRAKRRLDRARGALRRLAVLLLVGGAGLLRACAAWRAGLTRGATPLAGAARVAGLVGAFIAGLNIVLTLGGFLLAGLGH